MQAADSRRNACRLLLFVTGDAPRSMRARAHLRDALESEGLADIRPCEVDLLETPQQAITHGVFATPALLRQNDEGRGAILYGDLSDVDSLKRFLAELHY